MKLYDGGRAPNPRRVQIFLKEKGISIPAEQVDINALEQRSAGITAKNPLQRLPILELDDGTCISESIAICRYLEELHPDPPLFGSNPLERAVTEMWNRRVEMYFMAPVAYSFRHLHPGAAHLEAPQVEAWGKVNQERAIGFLPILEDQLAEHQFIAGEKFSVADITALVAFQFFKPARLAVPESMKHVSRWLEEVSARPSVQLDA